MENRNDRFRRKNFIVIDRFIIRLAVIAVSLLIVSQTLLLNAEARKHLSLVDKLEGEQITSPTTMYAADVPWPDPNRSMNIVKKVVAKSMRTLRSGKDITIRMITPSASDDVFVTVNGEIAGNFARGKVDFTIYEGDYVEIDAAKLQKVQFIIDTHKNELVCPVDGIMLEGQNSIISVGKVIFKQ